MKLNTWYENKFTGQSEKIKKLIYTARTKTIKQYTVEQQNERTRLRITTKAETKFHIH